GPTSSLGIIAGDCIPDEVSPATIPQRHVAGDRFPQRHVAGERPDISLGKDPIVVVWATIQSNIRKIRVVENEDDIDSLFNSYQLDRSDDEDADDLQANNDKESQDDPENDDDSSEGDNEEDVNVGDKHGSATPVKNYSGENTSRDHNSKNTLHRDTNVEGLEKCVGSAMHAGTYIEEKSTSAFDHDVKDKGNNIPIPDTLSSYVPDYFLVFLGRRSSSVPIKCTRKKKYSSLKLINPIDGIRKLDGNKKCATQPNKSGSQPINRSQPSLTISDSDEGMDTSDSFSKIERCNKRILAKPSHSCGSDSNEISNTIYVGNQIGFKMNGKECIQETMASNLDHFLIKSLWNNSHFDFASKNYNGKSGGIVVVWDTDWFTLTKTIDGDGFLALHRRWRGLTDLPLGGKLFTRMNNLSSKHSKIDRFLVSDHIIQKWPSSHVLALSREFLEHTPLLLLNSALDFEPTPFKLYNSWIEHSDFPMLVHEMRASPTDDV
ncbi:hypothetical protein Tco_1365643, partial [Tanacetum coccineum]